MTLECGVGKAGMEQKLVGTALLAGVAAFLLDPGSAEWVRGQLVPLVAALPQLPTGALPQLPTAAGILCLVAIPILWLRPR